MPRKVHLTFLWTDESVMLEDFSKKISRRMLEWAKDFYAPYGIELVVNPAPNVGSVALAHKFALVKSDGVVPDFDLGAEIAKEYDAKRDRNHEESEVVDRELKRLFEQVEATPSSNPTRLDSLLREIRRLTQRSRQLLEERLALFEQEEREVSRRDYDTRLRLQMTDKYLFGNIGGDTSLNVVFARIKYRQSRMSPRYEGSTVGITSMFPHHHPVVFAPGGIPIGWVWPYTYILVGITRFSTSTLAHELVHAVGEVHPPPQRVIKNLDKLLNFRPPKLQGSLLDRAIIRAIGALEYQSLFKEVPGGYFDGPANDIMNYSADGTEPSEFILHDSDRQRFFNPGVPFITD